MQNANKNPEWYDQRVESFVDEQLPPAELYLFELQFKNDAELRQKVADAETVASVLRTQEHALCPPGVTDAVLQYARENQETRHTPDINPVGIGGSFVDRGRAPLRRVSLFNRYPFLKPDKIRTAIFLAAACLALLLIVKPFSIAQSGSTTGGEEAYSEQEVDRALREAKFALALVSDASRNTGRAIRSDAVKPLREAFGHVLMEQPSEVDRNDLPPASANQN